MWQYLVKRLLLMAMTLFGISVLCFLIVTMAPGDPAAMKAQALASGGQSNLDEQTLRKNQELYYLDRPTFFNPRPPTRTTTVAATLEELDDEENEARRKDALARLKGTIGTAALAQLIPELAPRVAEAAKRAASLDEQLAALRGPGAAAARVALGSRYGSFEPQLPPGSDDAAWADAWERRTPNLVAQLEAPARRVLEALAHSPLVLEQEAGELPGLQREAAWLGAVAAGASRGARSVEDERYLRGFLHWYLDALYVWALRRQEGEAAEPAAELRHGLVRYDPLALREFRGLSYADLLGLLD